MNIDPLSDQQILESWQRNASPWVDAVRRGAIESRRLVTDQAIVTAVLDCQPATVIDLGCGEGWLIRQLLQRGIQGVGVDAIPALVNAARASCLADFRVLDYAQVAAGALGCQADVVVCNFSLLGKEAVEQLIQAIPTLLLAHGTLLIQTLHPLQACGSGFYVDGWRPGSWEGFSEDFQNPAPWYFRTLESWVQLLQVHGLRLSAIREPLHPQTGRPVSVIFAAR